jgi:hypothetical protein
MKTTSRPDVTFGMPKVFTDSNLILTTCYYLRCAGLFNLLYAMQLGLELGAGPNEEAVATLSAGSTPVFNLLVTPKIARINFGTVQFPGM